jgi:hypothetical protein
MGTGKGKDGREMKSERDALCGDPRCKERRRIGLDTRPRVHGTESRYAVVPMVGHPFVFGGGNAT